MRIFVHIYEYFYTGISSSTLMNFLVKEINSSCPPKKWTSLDYSSRQRPHSHTCILVVCLSFASRALLVLLWRWPFPTSPHDCSWIHSVQVQPLLTTLQHLSWVRRFALKLPLCYYWLQNFIFLALSLLLSNRFVFSNVLWVLPQWYSTLSYHPKQNQNVLRHMP